MTGAEDPYVAMDPFQGEGRYLTWLGEVNVAQLQAELRTALGETLQMAVYPPVDGGGEYAEPTVENPTVIYLWPPSVDLGEAKEVLAGHRPDPYYGMSASERQDAELVAKVKSSSELSMEEMRAALRLLME